MATPYRRFRQINNGDNESAPLLGVGGRGWSWPGIVLGGLALCLAIAALGMAINRQVNPVPDPLSINHLHANSANITTTLIVGGNTISKRTEGEMAISVSGDAMFKGSVTSESQIKVGIPVVEGKRNGHHPSGRIPPNFQVNVLTAYGSVNVGGNLQVNGTATVEDLKIVDMLDTSTSKVKPAPIHIFVGSYVAADWPRELLPGSKRYANAMRDITERSIQLRARNPGNAKRVLEQQIPVTPSFLPTISPFPPVGTVYVSTIKQAMELLQGKVITNTTIFLAAGTYNENVAVDGFVSNCGGDSLSNDINDDQGPYKCRGLTIVGDARLVAGLTYTHGELNDLTNDVRNPILGSGKSETVLTCLNSSALSIVLVSDPSTGGLVNDEPDFVLLGIKPNDKIVLQNRVAKTISNDLTVTGVSENVISFSGSTCTPGLFGFGDSITFLPNRKLQGSASVLTTGGLELYENVPAVLSVSQRVSVIGLMASAPTLPPRKLITTCSFSQLVYFSNIVCDDRTLSTLAESVVISGGNTFGFAPRFETYQVYGDGESLDGLRGPSATVFGHVRIRGGNFILSKISVIVPLYTGPTNPFKTSANALTLDDAHTSSYSDLTAIVYTETE